MGISSEKGAHEYGASLVLDGNYAGFCDLNGEWC